MEYHGLRPSATLGTSSKASYRELREKYGYGTLVVGMPLWFAVPPDEPYRPENALDDFMTRTAVGLEDVRRRLLRRRDCPFRIVIMIWDMTPQALREWREGRRGRPVTDLGGAGPSSPPALDGGDPGTAPSIPPSGGGINARAPGAGRGVAWVLVGDPGGPEEVTGSPPYARPAPDFSTGVGAGPRARVGAANLQASRAAVATPARAKPARHRGAGGRSRSAGCATRTRGMVEQRRNGKGARSANARWQGRRIEARRSRRYCPALGRGGGVPLKVASGCA